MSFIYNIHVLYTVVTCTMLKLFIMSHMLYNPSREAGNCEHYVSA